MASSISTGLSDAAVWGLWGLLAALAMLAMRPMPLRHDSFQYLNAAENFSDGRGMVSSLVQYDTERTHGRIPAPLTTFPPGYPFAVAMASHLGNPETAARILSCLFFAGTSAFLALGLSIAGVSLFLRHAVSLLFVTNAVTLSFSTAALTESMFTFFAVGAVVLMLRSEAGGGAGMAAAACVFGALSYVARYAGVFVIAPVICYALYRWKGSQRWRFLAGPVLAGFIAGSVMLRNVLQVGTWRGGNEMEVNNPLGEMLDNYVRAQLHVVSGVHAVTAGLWELLLAVGILGVIALVWSARRDGEKRRQYRLALLVGIPIIVYSAGLLYAGLHTVILLDTRMFVPMLPLYLLLFGLIVHLWAPKPGHSLHAALALLVIGYAGVNARDFRMQVEPSRIDLLGALFAKPMANGQPLRQWVDANIGSDEAVLAVDGQATGFLLRRPSLSMVTSKYTQLRWECDEVKRQMRRFHIRHVILYNPLPDGSPENDDFLIGKADFVTSSVAGQPPCGFEIAAENSGIRILKPGAIRR